MKIISSGLAGFVSRSVYACSITVLLSGCVMSKLDIPKPMTPAAGSGAGSGSGTGSAAATSGKDSAAALHITGTATGVNVALDTGLTAKLNDNAVTADVVVLKSSTGVKNVSSKVASQQVVSADPANFYAKGTVFGTGNSTIQKLSTGDDEFFTFLAVQDHQTSIDIIAGHGGAVTPASKVTGKSAKFSGKNAAAGMADLDGTPIGYIGDVEMELANNKVNGTITATDVTNDPTISAELEDSIIGSQLKLQNATVSGSYFSGGKVVFVDADGTVLATVDQSDFSGGFYGESSLSEPLYIGGVYGLSGTLKPGTVAPGKKLKLIGAFGAKNIKP